VECCPYPYRFKNPLQEVFGSIPVGPAKTPSPQLRRCEKIAKNHQVGGGYWKSFTAVHFLSPAVVIESFNRVDDL
jgi:hypothetical protein